MARQLLQDRTPAAYAGVEAYARRHGSEDAGALAWLVVGYAHILDHDYAQAIPALSRAHPHAGDIGDYVDYYRGESYAQTGRIPEAMAVLSEFEKKYPESLLITDAHLLYANLLVTEGQAQAAAALLEENRKPVRADIELALGRAYAAAGDNTKATAIFSNLYFTMPLSFEATQAGEELKKISPATLLPLHCRSERREPICWKKESDIARLPTNIVPLLNDVPAERPALQLSLVEALRRAGRIKEAKQALESVPNAPPEINAGRLFNLGEIAWAENDNDTFLKILDQLRQADPTSPYLEQALLEAGNIYLLRPDYDHAIDCYRELQSRFPECCQSVVRTLESGVAEFAARPKCRSEDRIREPDRAISKLRGDSCGFVLEGATGAGRWRSGDGRGVLPEAVAAIPQFLLWRTGSRAIAEDQGERPSAALCIVGSSAADEFRSRAHKRYRADR